MKVSKLAIAAMVGLGLTTGFASTSMASLASYAEFMPKNELDRVVQRTEKMTGIKLTEVAVWSSEKAPEYNRFWQSFAYNYDECVVTGSCIQSWDYFGIGGDGSGGAGGGNSGGAGDGGGGSGAAGGVD